LNYSTPALEFDEDQKRMSKYFKFFKLPIIPELYFSININSKYLANLGEISTTTQFIWGNKDMALGRKGAEQTENYMKGKYNFIELDLGHWLIQEDYDTISSTILNFINENSIN